MLNEKIIDALKPLNKNYKVTDKEGLYLFCNTRGGKYWRFDYIFEGKRKTFSIGPWPKVPLPLARVQLLNAKNLLKNGFDPSHQKQLEKAARRPTVKPKSECTFEYVAMRWFRHWKHEKNPKYVSNTIYRLRQVVFPAFGSVPIHEIQFSHIRILVEKLVRKGVFDIAKRTLHKFNQIMRYAFVHEYITVPIPVVEPGELIPSRRTRHHFRIQTHEIPKLCQDIHEFSGSPITIIALKLLLLTFVRTQELIKAQWKEIVWERKIWIIPEDRMKMRKEHVVPLSEQVLELLERLKNFSGNSKWLFPSTRGNGAICNNTILFALYRLGYKGKMTGHGFRGLASTALHEMDWPHLHIEVQLAHSARSSVSSAYNFARYLPQRQKMMQAWSDFIYQQAPEGF